MSTMNSRLTIFYSWQSDLRDTRVEIESALTDASQWLSAEYPELHALVDQATRELPGSPNIPQAILDKIEVADVGVFDITTINSSPPGQMRAVPNPNVLFELGYFVARHGWARVLLIFNKDHALAETHEHDWPFDFDRHRIHSFSLAKSGRPTHHCKIALKAIVEANPLRPTHVNPEKLKREKDIKTMLLVFDGIDTNSIARCAQEAFLVMRSQDFQFVEDFVSKFDGQGHNFYDQTLSQFVATILMCSRQVLAFSHFYVLNPNNGMLVYKESEAVKNFSELAAARVGSAKWLWEAIVEIAAYIHKEYPEFDLVESNRKASEAAARSQSRSPTA